ncbi:MAG: SurA N-terminal domain-containing protein [bacterium]
MFGIDLKHGKGHLTNFPLSLLAMMIVLVYAVGPVMAKHGNASSADSDKSSTDVAIKVDQETISQQEFNRAVQRQVKKMKQRMKRSKSKSPSKKMLRKQARKRVKKGMVGQLVLKSHAKKSGVTVSDSAVQQRWNRLLKRFGGEKSVMKKLKRKGMSKSEFLQRIRDQKRVKKFVRMKTPEVSVTDKELRTYYENNKKRFGKMPFKKAKRFLKRRLKQREKQQQRQQLVQELRKKSSVTINV